MCKNPAIFVTSQNDAKPRKIMEGEKCPCRFFVRSVERRSAKNPCSVCIAGPMSPNFAQNRNRLRMNQIPSISSLPKLCRNSRKLYRRRKLQIPMNPKSGKRTRPCSYFWQPLHFLSSCPRSKAHQRDIPQILRSPAHRPHPAEAVLPTGPQRSNLPSMFSQKSA